MVKTISYICVDGPYSGQAVSVASGVDFCRLPRPLLPKYLSEHLLSRTETVLYVVGERNGHRVLIYQSDELPEQSFASSRTGSDEPTAHAASVVDVRSSELE